MRSLIEKRDAEIHVIYVTTDIARHRGLYGNFQQTRIDRIYRWEKEKANERSDKICSKKLEGCPFYVKHVSVGDPAREIIKTVVAEDIDMVVLSTWGADGYSKVGGVANKIIKNLPIPVVMVSSSGEPVEMRMVS